MRQTFFEHCSIGTRMSGADCEPPKCSRLRRGGARRCRRPNSWVEFLTATKAELAGKSMQQRGAEYRRRDVLFRHRNRNVTRGDYDALCAYHAHRTGRPAREATTTTVSVPRKIRSPRGRRRRRVGPPLRTTAGPVHSRNTTLAPSAASGRASQIDVALARESLKAIRNGGYYGLNCHGILNGRALRVPKDKILVVLTAPGVGTWTAIALHAMQSLSRARDAEMGELTISGQRVYTRTFVPGERTPDLDLSVRQPDPSLGGLFRLPIPFDMFFADRPGFPPFEELKKRYENRNLLRRADPDFDRDLAANGTYSTTLRKVLHDPRLPSGVYILSACRKTGGVDAGRVLSSVQLLEFRKAYRALYEGDHKIPDAQPRTAAELDNYTQKTRILAGKIETWQKKGEGPSS